MKKEIIVKQSPTRVLQVIADFKKGGVQSDVMYPSRILSKKDVHFDVLLFTDNVGYYEDEFSQYGSIYRIPKVLIVAKYIKFL